MSSQLEIIKSCGLVELFSSIDIVEATRQDYLRRLPRFIRFVEQNGLNRDILLEYKKALRDDVTLGVSSKNKYLVSARIALRELYRQGKLALDLSVGVKSFTQNSKHKVAGLNRQEVERICQHLQNLDDSLRSSRLRVVVSLLLFQGFRQIEICRLDVKDIDLANNRIFIVGKGKIDSEPINTHYTTHKSLTSYLRKSQVKHGPLLTHLNRQSSGQRLSTRGLRLIFQELLGELKINKTTHGTRHFYATELIRHFKSDLTTVVRFTRHNSLEMLQVYDDEILESKKMVELETALPYRF